MHKLLNFSTQVAILVCACCVFSNKAQALYEGPTQIKMDSTNTAVMVWQDFDIAVSLFKVVGTRGNSGPWAIADLSEISGPTAVNVKAFPILDVAISPAGPSSASAVAVWLAVDLSGNRIIQASTLNSFTNAWSPSQTLSDVGIESPRDDFTVKISPNGNVIAVTWKNAPAPIFNRIAVSTNGGASWALPDTISTIN